jgi:hypothetical protein
MQWIFQQFPKAEVEDWAVTAWSICNARNRLVHEGCQLSPMMIRTEAMALKRDFIRAKLSAEH